MKKILNTEIIEDFRQIVNELDIHEKLSNVNEKDDYSFICSQMDWIEVWINELEEIDVNSNGFHTRTINIAQFILGVDTIITASKNLLDYFQYNTNPLFNSKDIFHQDTNDFLYFKRIRSAFAIHPIDIDIKRTKEKMFAGWVNSIHKDQFNVFIYNQKPNTPALRVTVSKHELIELVAKWYKPIEELTSHFKISNTLSPIKK